MIRENSLEEISDGRLYEIGDMVRVGCKDCEGCSACCRNMGTSLVLDPLDIHLLTTNLSMTMEELLNSRIELNMVDGMILPNMKMAGESNACPFLNENGRCRIHSFRPGFCRIFPMGRYYDQGSFKYILQIHECPKPNKTKVKLEKWIDSHPLDKNQRFVLEWHNFQKEVQELLKQFKNQENIKTVTMYVLQSFYMQPFSKDGDFYVEFDERIAAARSVLENVKNQLNIH